MCRQQNLKATRFWSERPRLTLKLLLLTMLASIGFGPALAQEEEPLLQPGEAYATRFSGIDFQDGKVVILKEGIVGSIVDVRNPGTAPKGQHWVDEPQRKFLIAEEVGQVFGIALDEKEPPNIFLTATSAFGLHRNADNSDWMAGMWGPDGGPGTIYKLNTETGYAPEVFADVKLGDRANTGASLGNIAFDKTNNQLFVSDLETGMIHSFDAETGAEKATYDHGVQGRPAFTDVETSSSQTLPEIAFDPSTSAKYEDCEAGEFSKTPECWNYADFRRRVWGLGVRTVADTGEVRLYYTVWGNQAFGNPDWAGAEDEQRNSMWSIGLGEDGAFDTSSIRREYFLPDFQVDAARIAEVGYSHAVTDIAFPQCTEQNIMLVSERGAVRNPGLQFEAPFSEPHESRMIRYELDESGNWLPAGRYDIGNYKRADEGEPAMKANSSGGVTFGYGYTGKWKIDLSKPNGFAWNSGHALCSAKTDGACFNPATGNKDDASEVHGVQGMPIEAFSEMVPSANADETDSTNQSYMIDLDINVDEAGAPIDQEMARNDATTSGDVEIYAICSAPTQTFIPPPPVHGSTATHRRWGSPQHTSRSTHRRWGSPQHSSRATHRRRGSDIHRDRASHRRIGSPQHRSRPSHRRWGSPEHRLRPSHRRWGSPEHRARPSHRRWGSPQHRSRPSHRRIGSPQHRSRPSHRRWGSPTHRRRPSHRRYGSPIHRQRPSHRRVGSPTHRQRPSHRRVGSPTHRQRPSHRRVGSPTHRQRPSHRRVGSPTHRQRPSHRRVGSPTHRQRASHRRTGSRDQHRQRASHRRTGSRDQHRQRASHRRTGSRDQHRQRASHRRTGSRDQHRQRASHRRTGSRDQHRQRASHRRTGSRDQHRQRASHRRTGSRNQHRQRASHRRTGSRNQHRQRASHRRTGSRNQHRQRQSHRRSGSGNQGGHRPRQSHRRTGSRQQSGGQTF